MVVPDGRECHRSVQDGLGDIYNLSLIACAIIIVIAKAHDLLTRSHL